MARGLRIRGAVGAIAAIALAACGSGGETPYEPVFQDVPTCLNCGADTNQEETRAIEPSAHIAVEPEQIMFYPTSEDSPAFDPHSVRVTNNTKALVVLTNSYLADDPWAAGGYDGAAYFATDPFEDKIDLAPGETAEFFVWFLGSQRQRSAQFVVTTTDPKHGSVSASLTGKYFLDTGF